MRFRLRVVSAVEWEGLWKVTLRPVKTQPDAGYWGAELILTLAFTEARFYPVGEIVNVSAQPVATEVA